MTVCTGAHATFTQGMLTTCMYGSVYTCGETLAHATFTQGMLTTCMYDSVDRCEETLAHATFTQRMLTNNSACLLSESLVQNLVLQTLGGCGETGMGRLSQFINGTHHICGNLHQSNTGEWRVGREYHR